MKRKIVIVEDDTAIRDILSIILQRNGYAVEEYVTGEPLMGQLESWPDLFLLDKQLADIDGLEICRHLKQQPETSHIPVIILSATPDLHKQVKDAGGDAFLEKPFTSSELIRVIENLLERSRMSLAVKQA
jgi:DNA-binding response OmpR family regulator